jgi:hypothetical protein
MSTTQHHLPDAASLAEAYSAARKGFEHFTAPLAIEDYML